MSALRLATLRLEPLVLRLSPDSRTVLSGVWHGVEHFLDPWTLSRLQPPMAVDLVSTVWRVVAARSLVRRGKRAPLVSCFTLFHSLHGIQALLVLGSGLFVASVLYGRLARRTGTILPGMVRRQVTSRATSMTLSKLSRSASRATRHQRPGPNTSWAGCAAALWALIFGFLHVAWAAGWYIGLEAEQARKAFDQPSFLAYDLGVAGLCMVAVGVALALVRPWGHRLPRWLVGGLAWTGTVVLMLRAASAVVQLLYLVVAGSFVARPMHFWDLWFCIGAILFGFSTWRYWTGGAKPSVAV